LKNYRQLTQLQRYQIYGLMKAGVNQSAIARDLQVHKATISRELRRNRGRSGYRPLQAQGKARARQAERDRTSIVPATWQQIETLLEQQWSPEQIRGRMRLEKQPTVSHEWIYQYVWADKAAGGQLYLQLRCQKLRRKKYGKSSRRGQIPDRRSIDERPAVVDRKNRLGDWEADTMIGRRHQQALVTLVERKSKLTRIAKVTRNTAAAMEQVTVHELKGLPRKTVTADNGREFAGHKRIAQRLNIDFFFAHPYCSWERGLNENTNGLIRQYFPKGHDFATITEDQITFVMEQLNNRPRKSLGYKTPNEVCFKLTNVALTS